MRRSRSTEPKRRNRPTSPAAVSGRSSAAVVLDNGPSSLLGDFQLSEDYYANSNPNPRSFPHNIKQQCWEKAEKIKGRDPDRWRKDALGNTVFRKLVGCPGCLCHDYDHILPYSKLSREEKARWKIVKYYRQQLIDQREIEQRCPKQILSRRVLTAEYQVVTWIFLNCLPMAMFGADQILGVGFVQSNEEF